MIKVLIRYLIFKTAFFFGREEARHTAKLFSNKSRVYNNYYIEVSE